MSHMVPISFKVQEHANAKGLNGYPREEAIACPKRSSEYQRQRGPLAQPMKSHPATLKRPTTHRAIKYIVAPDNPETRIGPTKLVEKK